MDYTTDSLPPTDWEPKSDFFKAIWAKAKDRALHRKWHLQCPDCGHYIDLDVSIPEPLPRQ